MRFHPDMRRLTFGGAKIFARQAEKDFPERIFDYNTAIRKLQRTFRRTEGSGAFIEWAIRQRNCMRWVDLRAQRTLTWSRRTRPSA